MSTKNVTLHDENGNVLLPATKTSRVTDANGTNLDTLLQQAGQVKSISVNGTTQTIDANGNVNIASADGVGIASVVQTTTSSEDGGTNVITVTKTDNTTSTFSVKNGSKGSTGATGPQGERGLPGESGVTGDVSGFTVHQTIDPSATYGATDIAGAASLQATNQELTELEGDMLVETDISISSIPSYSGYAIYATTNKWYKRSNLKYMLLSVSEGDVIRFKGNATNSTQYAYLHSNTVVDGSTPDYTPNTTLYTLGLGEKKKVVIPSGTAYLYFTQTFNSDRTPEYVKKDVAIKESLSEVDSRLSGRIDDINEAIDDFTTKTISISTTKNTLTNKFFDFVEGRKYNIKMTRVSGTGALPLTIQASSTSNSSHFNITTLVDGESEKEIVWTANSYKYIGLWSSTGSASVSLEITWSIPEEINEINNRLSECELVQKIKDSYFIDVEEDGLYFVDKYLHVGAKLDGSGFHAININEE